MKRVGWILVLITLTVACARPPKISPLSNSLYRATIAACDRVFPAGRWQVHHVIEATIPGGQKTNLMGVSVLTSHERSIRCALMTIEGLVLFAGDYDGRLTIERAVGPFERPGFAQGLMADLLMLYFRPKAPVHQAGRLPGGERICRFFSADGETTDVIVRDDQTWSVLKYDPDYRLERSIEARDLSETESPDYAFADHMTLKRHGMLGYQLELRLVEAVALSNGDK